MQNVFYLHTPSYIPALINHLGHTETTTVTSEAPVGPTLDDRSDIRIPDLMVSFDSRPDLIQYHGGYPIDLQGKPPDFVLEIASHTTGRIDYTDKRLDYARYGVTEYWRFDPTGGRYHDAALAGDRLVGRAYRPIAIEWQDETRCRGYSQALGLHLCWEHAQLRFYDPETGLYLRTHAEEIDRADAEAAARRQAEARAAGLEAQLRTLQQRHPDPPNTN